MLIDLADRPPRTRPQRFGSWPSCAVAAQRLCRGLDEIDLETVPRGRGSAKTQGDKRCHNYSKQRGSPWLSTDLWARPTAGNRFMGAASFSRVAGVSKAMGAFRTILRSFSRVAGVSAPTPRRIG